MAFPDEELDVIIEAYLGADPGANPASWATPEDLSDRLLDRPITITMGRQSGQKTLQAGQCTFWLDNDDGELTPLLETSSYYGTWDLGVPVRLSLNNVGASPPYRWFTGFIADITPDMVPTAGGGMTSAVRVTVAGPLRRLTQGAVVMSALRRTISANTSVQAYWPMEDGAGGQFGSGLSGKPGLSSTASVLETAPGPAGSGDLVIMEASTALSGAVDGTFPAQWSVTFVAKFDAPPSGMTTLMEFRVSGGSAVRWVLAADSTTFYLTGYDSTGAAAFVDSISGSEMSSGEWFGIEATAFVVFGPTYFYGIQKYALDGTVQGSLNSPVSITPGAVTSVRVPASSELEGLQLGHLVVANSGPLWFVASSEAGSPIPAYIGEEAHDRIDRVAEEMGSFASISGSVSVQMGPQTPADGVAILRDAEAVDHGILYETRTGWSLGYRALDARYNLDPAFTIALATLRTSDDPARVVTPVRNDQRLRNEWTVSRPEGSSATWSDAASIAKRGRYDDSATANVYSDDQLIHDAGFRVGEGTYEGLRYQTWPVDLTANNGGVDDSDDLIAAWLALVPGDRIDRTGHGAKHPAGTVSMVVEGWVETLHGKLWAANLNVEPYQPYQVNVLAEDDPGDDTGEPIGWLEADSCFLSAGVNSSAISWSVACSPAESADPDDYPFDAFIGGERVTVTASTGGTSPTWTVTRAVNGIAKAHGTTEPIVLTDPLILSLV